MDLKSIIKESIEEYLSTALTESEDDKKDKENDTYEKAKRRDGKNISSGDESQLRRDINTNELINVAALARLVYPKHTPEGAQSQLRKKLKGLKNDNGSEYHIKQREASTIRKALTDI